MKLITVNFSPINSFHMLIIYVVMNSIYKFNQVKASVASGNTSASNNGKCPLLLKHSCRCFPLLHISFPLAINFLFLSLLCYYKTFHTSHTHTHTRPAFICTKLNIYSSSQPCFAAAAVACLLATLDIIMLHL